MEFASDRPSGADDSYRHPQAVGVLMFPPPRPQGEAAMEPLAVAALLMLLVFLASVVAVELALSVAIIEIAAGVLAGNAFGIRGAPWLDFLAQLGGILLTFLAGAEVDPGLLRSKLGPSLALGGASFLLPFLAAAAVADRRRRALDHIARRGLRRARRNPAQRDRARQAHHGGHVRHRHRHRA